VIVLLPDNAKANGSSSLWPYVLYYRQRANYKYILLSTYPFDLSDTKYNQTTRLIHKQLSHEHILSYFLHLPLISWCMRTMIEACTQRLRLSTYNINETKPPLRLLRWKYYTNLAAYVRGLKLTSYNFLKSTTSRLDLQASRHLICIKVRPKQRCRDALKRCDCSTHADMVRKNREHQELLFRCLWLFIELLLVARKSSLAVKL